MKTLSILALLCIPAFGQTVNQVYAPVPPSSFPALDRNLNSKPSFTGGVGAPTSACTATKDLYVSTAGAFYVCTATNVWSLQGGGGGGISALTGDVTASGTGSVPATLATVNSGPGNCGDATHVCAIQTNAKGLVTAQAATSITFPSPGGATVVNITLAPYNALCNNTGNDQVAYDAAYVALTALGGGIITAPGGSICRITTLITAKSNVVLSGSFTISQATASAFAINFSGTTNAAVDGVVFVNGGIVGTTASATTGLRLTNVTVQNVASSTFPFNVGFYSTATLTNTRISGSRFTSMQSAMYMSGTVSGFALSQNIFTTISVNDGIQFPTGGTYSGLQLIDNKGSGFAAQGIEIQGTLGDQALVRGNNFSGVTGFGISNGAVGAGILADGNVLAGTGSYGIELGANSTATNNKVSGFGQGITVNGGPNDVIANNTVSQVGNCIYASNSGTSDSIKVLGNVCNEPTSNGIVMIDGSGSGGVISGNTVNRTPITGDGSSTVVCYFGGSAATARTWSNNACNWLSGTHGASANYWGVLLTADVPGSRYDGFRINNASGSATNMLGINCNSFSTELNGTAVTGNQFTNLTTGISCPTSSTMQYALNYLNPGTTPLGFGMVGSNVSGAQKFFGTAAPGSVAGNLPGDLFSDTTNHNEYWCNATAATVQPACTTVAVGGWTKLNGTGGGGTIPSTTSALKGDGAGNAAAVTGTGTDCVLVNGGSGTCGAGYTSDGTILIAGSVLGVQTAVIPSKVNLQSGTTLLVTTTSSSGTTYTGTMSPTLTAYTAGGAVQWNVGSTACSAGAKTINVDVLGAKSLFAADGSTNLATTDCPANRLLTLIYDGTAFRMIAGGAAGAGTTVTVASGTAAMGTGAITSGTCAMVVTATATGTATTDNIMADFNADPTSTTGYAPVTTGMLTIIKYPTTNTANFKVCNTTSASVTPGAVTLNWRVVR